MTNSMPPVNVGRSWRTPIKHDYLWYLAGEESGAIPKLGARRGIWYDLTAGDAATIDEPLPDDGGDVALFDINGTEDMS